MAEKNKGDAKKREEKRSSLASKIVAKVLKNERKYPDKKQG